MRQRDTLRNLIASEACGLHADRVPSQGVFILLLSSGPKQLIRNADASRSSR